MQYAELAELEVRAIESPRYGGLLGNWGWGLDDYVGDPDPRYGLPEFDAGFRVFEVGVREGQTNQNQGRLGGSAGEQKPASVPQNNPNPYPCFRPPPLGGRIGCVHVLAGPGEQVAGLRGLQHRKVILDDAPNLAAVVRIGLLFGGHLLVEPEAEG